MPHGGPPSALPLRPLTTAEVLDAAVSLLRAYGGVLLPAGVVLAGAEQLALLPLRELASADPPAYLPTFDGSGAAYWLLLAVGCGTEATIIALLGGLSARGAAAEVLGRRLSSRQLLSPRGGRLPAVILLAAAAGMVTFLTTLLGPLWALGYAIVGLAVPALMIDRVGPGRALARGASLSGRAGARAGAIRLLGYLTWLIIRLVVGLGSLATLGWIGVDRGGWATVAGALIWPLVNALAYPSLACLDAVLHLETRMRTEGLDIWLTRAAKHGQLVDATLKVSR